VLRSDDHVRCPEERIGTGGVHFQLGVHPIDLEGDGGTFTAADPVALHELHRLRPVHAVQVGKQLVCVFGDLQHPLADVLANHRGSAPFALPFLHFLVGQAGFACLAPVDRGV